MIHFIGAQKKNRLSPRQDCHLRRRRKRPKITKKITIRYFFPGSLLYQRLRLQIWRQMPWWQRLSRGELLRWPRSPVPDVRLEGEQNGLQQGVRMLQRGKTSARSSVIHNKKIRHINHGCSCDVKFDHANIFIELKRNCCRREIKIKIPKELK